MTSEKKSSKDRLVELVGKHVAEDAYEFDGFIWAARPQSFYASEVNLCHQQTGRLIGDAPFVSRPKIIGAKVTVTGEDVKIEGGTKVQLFRARRSYRKGSGRIRSHHARRLEKKARAHGR